MLELNCALPFYLGEKSNEQFYLSRFVILRDPKETLTSFATFHFEMDYVLNKIENIYVPSRCYVVLFNNLGINKVKDAVDVINKISDILLEMPEFIMISSSSESSDKYASLIGVQHIPWIISKPDGKIASIGNL